MYFCTLYRFVRSVTLKLVKAFVSYRFEYRYAKEMLVREDILPMISIENSSWAIGAEYAILFLVHVLNSFDLSD